MFIQRFLIIRHHRVISETKLVIHAFPLEFHNFFNRPLYHAHHFTSLWQYGKAQTKTSTACSVSMLRSLRGDKVSMLTHTYEHKPQGILKRPYAIIRLTAYFMCSLMSDMVSCTFRKCTVIHDTECPL